MVVGLLLATLLILAGSVTIHRQRQALLRLGEEAYVAEVDRRYRHGQARRRMLTSGVLVVIGGMIGGYYLSGMDARMDAIADRDRRGAPPGEPDPQADEDKKFTRLVGFYWIGIMGLVFVAVCFAVFDFWATRNYWMARYKELKTEHEAKLQRDLAVFRQKKLNERVPGLKPPTAAGDTPDDDPQG